MDDIFTWTETNDKGIVWQVEPVIGTHGIIVGKRRYRKRRKVMRLRWFVLGVLIGIALMLLADAIDARQRGEL